MRTEIAKFYHTELTGVHVFEHGGRFDLEELKRISTKTPALAVSLLGVPRMTVEGGVAVADASWALFPVTTDAQVTKRDASAIALVNVILSKLPSQRWASTADGPPQSIEATNLYSSTLDRTGINLWLVRWRQTVSLPNVTFSNLDDFLRSYTTWDLEPLDTPSTVDAEDRVTLPGV
jgi:phage gp37-like protein